MVKLKRPPFIIAGWLKKQEIHVIWGQYESSLRYHTP